MNIKSILENFDKSVISEETATAIAEAFEIAVNEKVNSKLELELENATSKIDEDHAEKLKKLLEAIDTDHTEKLEKVVDAINEDHTTKLEKLSNFYKKALNEKADEFSTKIVEQVSNFLDIALDKAIPQAQLNEAVENIYARKKLNEIRSLVGIDQEHIDASIKNTISEGKSKLDDLSEKLNESYKENEILLNKINAIEAKTLLSEKTKGMPTSKKEFVYKILNDKESSYIEENFNYVVEMFERSEEETSNKLAEEAKQKAQTFDAKVPNAKSLISESKTENKSNGFVDEYLNELNRK